MEDLLPENPTFKRVDARQTSTTVSCDVKVLMILM